MDVPSFLKKQNLKYLFQRIFKFPTFSTFGPDISPYLIAVLSLSLYIYCRIPQNWACMNT